MLPGALPAAELWPAVRCPDRRATLRACLPHWRDAAGVGAHEVRLIKHCSVSRLWHGAQGLAVACCRLRTERLKSQSVCGAQGNYLRVAAAVALLVVCAPFSLCWLCQHALAVADAVAPFALAAQRMSRSAPVLGCAAAYASTACVDAPERVVLLPVGAAVRPGSAPKYTQPLALVGPGCREGLLLNLALCLPAKPTPSSVRWEALARSCWRWWARAAERACCRSTAHEVSSALCQGL